MAKKKTILQILRRMVEITMVRGAQSGGVVTYSPSANAGAKGLRTRVVNGKRTNLAQLVHDKLKRTLSAVSAENSPPLFCGHTRFATSSLATLDGCHPHRWCAPQMAEVWDGFRDGRFTLTQKNVEHYICHNGDFDALKVGAETFPLGSIQGWLERVLGTPKPSVVDSAAIAGMVDVLRTQGMWLQSVRYAFLFAVPRVDLNYTIPSSGELQVVAAVFQQVFTTRIDPGMEMDCNLLRQQVIAEVAHTFQQREQAVLGFDEETGTLMPFVQCAVDAFFDNDLLQSVRTFMANAKGSFGLCVSSTLDCHRQFLLAARGQTLSVAFYPQLKLLLYGSEQAAVQAALEVLTQGENNVDSTVVGSWTPLTTRLDLDDLGGEICLLDWGDGRPSASREAPVYCDTVDVHGCKLTVTLVHESRLARPRFEQRLVPLERNPLILPLPKASADPVGQDISEIPKVLRAIQNSFHTTEGLNRVTAATFVRKLEQRLRRSAAGLSSLKPPNEVDVLITGCEVSLWVGEQFASDLSQVFPGLAVRVVSSNKLLGLKGHHLPHAPTGFMANAQMDLTDCIAIICSHSGGTFAPLAVANLLQPLTRTIFLVTSQWDTQVGKQLRQAQWFPCIFSTNVGLRPAEPCSLSVVATHHLLTGLLVYTMRHVHEKKLSQVTGAGYTDMDIHQLETNMTGVVASAEEIVGVDCCGVPLKTETSEVLRAKGRFWANHVIEAPICWILMFVYIMVTVGIGYPMLTGIALACGLPIGPWKYALQVADALLYVLIPQWTPALVRLVQRRTVLHRNSCRTVVVGDVPWVAQSTEAFLSKLFAVTYNNTSISVYSGNPADHLVHRFTHRIVRGVLVACGRPDGRLSALTAVESSVGLAISQASSIQHLNTTCETLTIGHNPHPLSLAHHTVVLKGQRPDYLCERLLKERAGKDALKDKGSAALAELYGALLHKTTLDPASRGVPPSPITPPVARSPGSLSIALKSPTFTSFQKAKEDSLQARTLRAMAGENMKGEKYFGQFLRYDHPDTPVAHLIQSQHLSMQLYEARIASLERLIAFFVLFHAMGHKVAQFWKYVSLGLLAYEMHRTQSIMRIATTASPVSGAEVREQMLERAAERQLATARRLLRMAVIRWKLARQLHPPPSLASGSIYSVEALLETTSRMLAPPARALAIEGARFPLGPPPSSPLTPCSGAF